MQTCVFVYWHRDRIPVWLNGMGRSAIETGQKDWFSVQFEGCSKGRKLLRRCW